MNDALCAAYRAWTPSLKQGITSSKHHYRRKWCSFALCVTIKLAEISNMRVHWVLSVNTNLQQLFSWQLLERFWPKQWDPMKVISRAQTLMRDWWDIPREFPLLPLLVLCFGNVSRIILDGNKKTMIPFAGGVLAISWRPSPWPGWRCAWWLER